MMGGRVRRSYLVCATQRSGSTLLCELLKDTGVAGRPEEYFEAERDTGVPPHPGHFLEGLPPTGAGIRDDPTPPRAPPYSSLEQISDYREHLARTFAAGTTENGVFGTKLMLNQLPELRALTATLPELADLPEGELLAALFGDPAYVWVSRRDKVRQAVSLWKALQTRQWRSREGGGAAREEPQYRFEGIDHLVRRFESADRDWQEHFARNAVTPLVIGYEDDLLRDPDTTIRTVLRHIGVAAPEDWRAVAATDRQADEISELWVDRYHRDRAEHGPSTAHRTATRSR